MELQPEPNYFETRKHNKFSETAKYNYLFRYGQKIKWFVVDVEIIEKGLNIEKFSEQDLAKRMNIGTIVGKYHQKALLLKGIK